MSKMGMANFDWIEFFEKNLKVHLNVRWLQLQVFILCASKKTGATAESVMSIGYDCMMVGQLTNY